MRYPENITLAESFVVGTLGDDVANAAWVGDGDGGGRNVGEASSESEDVIME